jgi:hypothetical protein
LLAVGRDFLLVSRGKSGEFFQMRACAVLLAVVAGMCQAQEDPPKILRSPDGAYAVRMVDKPAPGADPVMDFFTLEVLRGGTTIARVPTYGYLVDAHWSPDGAMVAVNNRRGNTGDYVWVFALEDGRVLKRADDKIGRAWEKAAFKAMAKGGDRDLERWWTTALGWKDAGRLEVNVRARFPNATRDFGGTADFTRNPSKLTPDG